MFYKCNQFYTREQNRFAYLIYHKAMQLLAVCQLHIWEQRTLNIEITYWFRLFVGCWKYAGIFKSNHLKRLITDDNVIHKIIRNEWGITEHKLTESDETICNLSPECVCFESAISFFSSSYWTKRVHKF